MASSARPRPRWPLHPLAAALVLLTAGMFAAVSALARRDMATAAAGLLLVAVAGAAAGFANSGST
ncbi:hypothetical protein [Pseudonocardia sp. H11422]|uniref:hypothetical protein n=1 Tax=Pseudonocardia sp. H11422 TaxID=2835866 RepID=UPI001BDD5880|nr:hypothetical protein [Pseudonocardia sp. H11422]